MTNRAIVAFACFSSLIIGAAAQAQCPMEGSNGQCFLSSVPNYDPNYVPNPSLAPLPGPAQGKDHPPVLERTIGVAGGAYVATKVGYGIAAKAAGVAQVGQVADVPVYGSAIKGIPIIGAATAHVGVPTTLGGVPFLGKAVSSIPVAGPIIAGPPNPILVGAVAVDTYILPKFSPTGYTESSMFTMTDFNSPPRLRNYVNYLAPLPYTHPPIYAPAARGANLLPRTAAAQTIAEITGETVNVEN